MLSMHYFGRTLYLGRVTVAVNSPRKNATMFVDIVCSSWLLQPMQHVELSVSGYSVHQTITGCDDTENFLFWFICDRLFVFRISIHFALIRCHDIYRVQKHGKYT